MPQIIMPDVKIHSATPDIEKSLVLMARQSSKNPSNDDTTLLASLIRRKHWSPFEMGNVVFQVRTSRAVARQILRHRSFSFQEESQRYKDKSGKTELFINPTLPGATDRQAALFCSAQNNFLKMMEEHAQKSKELYELLLRMGYSKESARYVLPEAESSSLGINGNMRSWIHYLQLRLEWHTQLDHRLVAYRIYEELKNLAPLTMRAANLEPLCVDLVELLIANGRSDLP